ncbi:cytochrome oxidase subunit I [Chitinophaga parva]|uniref:Cytochrome oxidase subunit I n=2 Tax=Chitinophaga parva TaxID=2169414 RepID=A0A2T7BI11_9BACT|nr:cytochrome oxidase subunit I [Chitinophaga parva]
MALPLFATPSYQAFFSLHSMRGLIFILVVLIVCLLVTVAYLYSKVKQLQRTQRELLHGADHFLTPEQFQEYLSSLDSRQIGYYLQRDADRKTNSGSVVSIAVLLACLLGAQPVFAQSPVKGVFPFTDTGVVITMILILLPILGGALLLIAKVMYTLHQYRNKQAAKDAAAFEAAMESAQQHDATQAVLEARKQALDYQLSGTELGGKTVATDSKGLLKNISTHTTLPVVSQKKSGLNRPGIDPQLARIVIWYIVSAALWLLIGTTVGEYVGIKFVAPDVDHVSFLSFGRLRPVHTNMVFWGWSSLGMLGLAHYIVPRVGNNQLASYKRAWYALILINASVLLGTWALMSGVNNSGGEYREYIWPIMLLFGIGVVICLVNFLQTIARRQTKEIYIANWYIVSAIIFGLTIEILAYLPMYQNGLGETIIQGYFMHQGVGMWFMFFTLGIVYYFLPQQLNKPIYSYSLGILAFWTQILFYTVIGTHHFIFSAVPWWLQTVAIVGSGGMVIPVVAGATNFILTFKGVWYKVASSYTLPFFIVGIIFYFTGSLQGTAEAFRSTNLIWHFTDFTVAHSHLTMYGIIAFFLWAGIYAVVPRLTGREAPQITVGIHFWLSLIGLLFYAIPLMYGATLKGLLWQSGKPFIDGVVLMAPYWLWRAIGGSLMWLGHVFFVYNLYRMIAAPASRNATEAAGQQLNAAMAAASPQL